jgi:hypothetical protein
MSVLTPEKEQEIDERIKNVDDAVRRRRQPRSAAEEAVTDCMRERTVSRQLQFRCAH